MSAENVVTLPVRPKDEAQVDATVGYHFDEKRQLRFDIKFPEGATFHDKERQIAEAMDLSAITGLSQSLIEIRAILKNALEQQKLAETPPKRLEEIKVEIGTHRADKAEKLGDFERQFRASGRQGQFRPAGAQKNELMGYEQKIDQLEKESIEVNQKHGIRVQELKDSVTNAERAISNFEAEIEIRRKAHGQ